MSEQNQTRSQIATIEADNETTDTIKNIPDDVTNVHVQFTSGYAINYTTHDNGTKTEYTDPDGQFRESNIIESPVAEVARDEITYLLENPADEGAQLAVGHESFGQN